MSKESDVLHGTTENLADLARSLVARALDCFDPTYGFSTASCQLYDTAWVSMICKTTNGEKQWLFPEAFHYLMRTQDTWAIDNVSQTVAILDSSAGLLALLKHAAEPLQIDQYSTQEISERIALATISLASQLEAWNDIESTNHIGVEIIAPAMLQYLKDEDPSLTFSFPCEDLLARMHAAKMSRFRIEMLYGKSISPASYSLEAFIGKIDFDLVQGQQMNGSMWTSPSSTAAYLMNASTWSTEAEDWLRHVVNAGEGRGDGSVPGTFPTHQFELNWAVATLLQSGFRLSNFDEMDLTRVAEIVRAGFAADGGVIGHAPGTVDVDDTAKGLLALKLLGQERDISPDIMIRLFEKKDAFGTMAAERDRSVSSNCHVLLALLAWNDYSRYGSQIRKAASFTCEYWWNANGRFKDKWHLSHLYPTMLMVKGFTILLRDVDEGSASELLGSDLSIKIAIAVFQACIRTLNEQSEDGSWDDSPEQTAYAILTLVEARKLCFFADLVPSLQSAIDSGVAYLESGTTGANGRYWTSKTRYCVRFVMEAYILSARHAAPVTRDTGNIGYSLGFEESVMKTRPFLPLLKLTKTFSTLSDQDLQASLAEAALFLPLLRNRRLEVFPRDDLKVSKDAYFDMLPFLWVGCSNRARNFVPTTFIFDMLFMTLINIQVDEFMEDIATQAFEQNPAGLHSLIDEATEEAWARVDSPVASDETVAFTKIDPKFRHMKVYQPLLRFSDYILNHGPIVHASPADRKALKHEFRQFLHTQTTQMEDNTMFRAQSVGKGQVFTTDMTYFNWVRTTASDHVSTPLNFAWVCCWSSGTLHNGNEVFSNPAEKYLASALSRHLAATNRMFNDLSSIARDTLECNLNSVHFPEFNSTPALKEIEMQKSALRILAEYEHGCVEHTMECLRREVKRAHPHQPEGLAEKSKLGPLRLLCDVSHLWDQLYLIRDHSSTMKGDRSST